MSYCTRKLILKVVFGAFLYLGLSGIAISAEWTITPTVIVSETYTDNVTLAANGQEDSDFITEVNPAISIRGEGRHLKLNFDYRMQNIFYADSSDRNAINHQLGADANAELIDKLLFLDLEGNIGQQSISNTGRTSRDNLSITNNRTDVIAYSISPYLAHRFGGYMDAELRYTYEASETGQGASDSESNGIDLSISSGRKFSRLKWSLNYSSDELDRDTTTDTKYESTSGEIRYAAHRKIDLVVQGGDENNDFNGALDTVNGSYWSAGFDWHPSQKISLQVLSGDKDESATLRINPMERTSLEVTYRDREVGTNPGGSWDAKFSHRTRRSTWNASYTETTTTTQEELLDDNIIFRGVDAAGRSIYENTETGETFINPPSGEIFSPTDEVFIRKRTQLSTSLRTGKSNINAGVYSEKREFQAAGDDEDIVGGNISWSWQFAPRTESVLSSGWQQTAFRSSTREDERFDLTLGISRSFSREARGSLNYTYYENDSSLSSSSYEENRISAQVYFSF